MVKEMTRNIGIQATKKYLSKNMRPHMPEVLRGKGILVYDKKGNEFFDLTSQTMNLNLGHGNQAIIGAVRRLLNKKEFTYYVSPWFESSYTVELASKLISLAPKGLARVNMQMCNGSDANEDAFKRVRKYHLKHNPYRRSMIMSFYGSHLGVSSETISASGEHFGKEAYLGGSGNFVFMEPCNVYRRPQEMSVEEYSKMKVDEFEKIVVKRGGDIAGVITELVSFDAGILVQPKTFIKGIERVCRDQDIALIIDEVQTAFGWCGDIFASNIYGIRPSIITMAKGLTAGFPALAASIFRDKYDILEPGTSEYTFGAQSISCTAALANINHLLNSKLPEKAKEKGNKFMRRLGEMKEKYPMIGDVRGIGLIIGIEFIRPDGSPNQDIAMRVYNETLKRGLLVNPPILDDGKDNIIGLKPPVIITEEEIDKAMDRFDESLGAVARRISGTKHG